MQAPERKKENDFPPKHAEYIKLKTMPRNKQFQKQESKSNWLCIIHCSCRPNGSLSVFASFSGSVKSTFERTLAPSPQNNCGEHYSSSMKTLVLSTTCWMSVCVCLCMYFSLWEPTFLCVGGSQGVRGLCGASLWEHGEDSLWSWPWGSVGVGSLCVGRD